MNNVKDIIYNRTGQPRLRLLADDSLVDFSGRRIGFISGEHLYNYNGEHVGWYEGGMMRDNEGLSVGFGEQITDSTHPLLPIKRIKPVPGIVAIKPIKPIEAIPSIKPIKSYSWSELDPVSLFFVNI